MKNQFCRHITFIVILVFLCCSTTGINVSAIENNTATNIQAADIAELWVTLRDTGKICIDDSGLFYVAENAYTDSPEYSQFLNLFQSMHNNQKVHLMPAHNPQALHPRAQYWKM